MDAGWVFSSQCTFLVAKICVSDPYLTSVTGVWMGVRLHIISMKICCSYLSQFRTICLLSEPCHINYSVIKPGIIKIVVLIAYAQMPIMMYPSRLER